jgi:farnesyl diphosphate synthase
MTNSVFAHYKARHEKTLEELLHQADIPAPYIKEAMFYVLFPGGKRFRPLLVYLCGQLFQIHPSALDLIAAAIECIHCYSLVHDDLPAMDNDDTRRGRPSCHRAFDEATAILVGDGLQAFAIELLLDHLPTYLSPTQTIAVARELVLAAGVSGMVSGQSLDLSELTNPKITETQLQTIHTLKTGKLILACANMVLASTTPSQEQIKALRTFAIHLGVGFQMQDDYLDYYGTNDVLGKGRSSDTANHKITFAQRYDQHALSDLILTHVHQAESALSIFENNQDLFLLLNTLKERTVSC